MNATLLKGLVVTALAAFGFSWSAVLFLRRMTPWSFLRLFGAACLVVVGLCHICEALGLFPGMRWGIEDSAGHYLDLWSCVLGLTSFPAGYLGDSLAKNR